MKRASLNEFDSLDLLLDTICDTFGGVLFVAVLIAVLASRTAEMTTGTARSAEKTSLESIQQTLSERKTELQSLQNALREQLATLKVLQAEQNQEQAGHLIALRRDISDLANRRAQYIEEMADLNQASGGLEESRQKLIASLELARKEELSLKQQCESDRANQIRTTNLPLLRQTSKREFPIVVRFGRLYLPFVAEQSLENRKSNLAEFVILDDSGPVVRVAPKPFAGLPIRGDDQSFNAIRQKLISLDKGKVYLAIGVWEDSFEQFQVLREVIVKLGYEYRLVPIASGEFIQESPVTETLVQ